VGGVIFVEVTFYRHSVDIGNGQLKMLFCFVFIGLAKNIFNECTHSRAAGTVVQPAFFFLADSFYGRFMLWHVNSLKNRFQVKSIWSRLLNYGKYDLYTIIDPTNIMIVVIDGPSGSGKSSTAREVAARSGFYFLDSGAFYRCFTLAYQRDGSDADRFMEKLSGYQVGARFENGEFRISLNGEDVTREIRGSRVTSGVSRIAEITTVRARVNGLLREVAKQNNIIADGRDLGTAVFPDADLKFFMVADLETRTQRRLKQLEEMGLSGDPGDIRNNLEDRDKIDSGREADPLRRAEDAILVDTSELEFEQQVELILTKIKELKNNR
jgi:CMP/dCMP kinase